ncbi:hypothetical protein RMSM_01216 [Rhodopirellula maiorica SM1]|uniref:Uncharacterized protein n=1 Tax=Rhodopirellula maiorica SM1 TaxID=1265738 RepID=M5RRA0_9BACT|nr:hypothetical protein RMSM_01216 [Rhodopirellula maiorica SM1]
MNFVAERREPPGKFRTLYSLQPGGSRRTATPMTFSLWRRIHTTR